MSEEKKNTTLTLDYIFLVCKGYSSDIKVFHCMSNISNQIYVPCPLPLLTLTLTLKVKTMVVFNLSN